MKNKYYTPEFHEFHEGFEYEDNLFNINLTKMFTYKEVEGWRKSFFIKGIDNNQIRVKLLDREDIESLGFELYIIKEHTISFLKKCTGFSVFIIYQETNTVISVYINAEKVFLGNIKNKSELQKLMTQLNIK